MLWITCKAVAARRSESMFLFANGWRFEDVNLFIAVNVNFFTSYHWQKKTAAETFQQMYVDTLTRRDFFYATISLIFLTFAKNESRAFVVVALFPGGAKGRRKTKLPEICQPSGNVLFLLQLLDMLISQLFLPCCRILIRCDVAREKYLRGKWMENFNLLKTRQTFLWLLVGSEKGKKSSGNKP